MTRLPVRIQARVEARDARLQAAGFADYRAYLNSPVWRGVKRRYVESGAPAVCLCGADEVQFHHMTYARVGGDELVGDLQPLCVKCHATVHELERRGEITLDLDGFEYDAERARKHRAELIAHEQDVEARWQRFADLPLRERVRRLRAANRAHDYGINKPLRAMEKRVAKLLARGDDPMTDGIIKRQAITATRMAREWYPAMIDHLMPKTS